MEVPDYDLPEHAIAQLPAEPRDSARLLVALGRALGHKTVADLPSLLMRGDVLVLNTSRVIPARLRLCKASGGTAEVLLLERSPAVAPASAEVGDGASPTGTWQALVRPGRRLPPGTALYSHAARPSSTGDLVRPLVEVGERLPDGTRLVRTLVGEAELHAAGELALPPYIHRPLADPSRYQTVYAERPGSVAAPTAGLHLTEDVLLGCRLRGVAVFPLDLAVGLGTFRPIRSQRAEEHAMHGEHYRVPEATWQAVREAVNQGRRVVAVGTTTMRALESVAATGLLEGRTELYIRPGHAFQAVNVLMTNFHQPRSTLLLMLEAFCGQSWRELYSVALGYGYRFLSFGDAMLVARNVPG